MTFRIPKHSGHPSGPTPGPLHRARFFAGRDRIGKSASGPTPGLVPGFAGEPERTLSNGNEPLTRGKVRWDGDNLRFQTNGSEPVRTINTLLRQPHRSASWLKWQTRNRGPKCPYKAAEWHAHSPLPQGYRQEGRQWRMRAAH